MRGMSISPAPSRPRDDLRDRLLRLPETVDPERVGPERVDPETVHADVGALSDSAGALRPHSSQ
jgi:hypothetical protein